jgi:hypothetical protein
MALMRDPTKQGMTVGRHGAGSRACRPMTPHRHQQRLDRVTNNGLTAAAPSGYTTAACLTWWRLV